MYWVAVHPADPRLILFQTNLGQFFRSTDGGETGQQAGAVSERFRALMWLPDCKANGSGRAHVPGHGLATTRITPAAFPTTWAPTRRGALAQR